jgi:hypothetical protein
MIVIVEKDFLLFYLHFELIQEIIVVVLIDFYNDYVRMVLKEL